MSRSTPSLVALLGLVAVAGYQNRGRISEMLADARQTNTDPNNPTATDTSSNGFLSEIGQFFGAGQSGTSISEALGNLVERFTTTGRGDMAESWVASASNRPLNVDELEAALGEETLDELAQKTGLSRADLLVRLNTALPEVVNRLTPNGRMPSDQELQDLI